MYNIHSLVCFKVPFSLVIIFSYAIIAALMSSINSNHGLFTVILTLRKSQKLHDTNPANKVDDIP